jgi:uncharacterized phage-like protein YoqJ
MKLAITGHRPDKLGNDYSLTSELIKDIESRLQLVIEQEQPEAMISGVALGIDTVWAKLALKNGIDLIAAVPCDDQDAKWSAESQQLYREILAQAKQVIQISPGRYTREKMDVRNKWMVVECGKIVAVWDGTPGGTANCTKYAIKVGRPIIYVEPFIGGTIIRTP